MPDVPRMTEALERIYSRDYDVFRCDDSPWDLRMEYHVRCGAHILTRSLEMWSAEDHEYVYVRSGDILDADALDACLGDSISDAMTRIRPGNGHRCSTVTTLLLFDSVTRDAERMIRVHGYHRSFRMSLDGWVNGRVGALVGGRILTDRLGRDLKKVLGQL